MTEAERATVIKEAASLQSDVPVTSAISWEVYEMLCGEIGTLSLKLYSVLQDRARQQKVMALAECEAIKSDIKAQAKRDAVREGQMSIKDITLRRARS